MKTDFWQEKLLCIIYPDDEPTSDSVYPTYRYSDELFDWFYSKLKYTSDVPNGFEPLNLHYKWTKKDHAANGCRIYDKNGNYDKLSETYFLVELTREEWRGVNIISEYDEVRLSDLVNYYYQEHKI